MIPSPILKVLSTIHKHQCRALLMGGQACVIYGSAEFSRDIDLAILADSENLSKIAMALTELQAAVIALPPFEQAHLDAGLAVHFRCSQPDCAGFRIDLMSRMRGVAPFEEIWERRTSVLLQDGTELNVMSIADLVQSKKTQRDKDWPMISRLVDVHYQTKQAPTHAEILFWLQETRSAQRLIEIVARFRSEAETFSARRPAVQSALGGDHESTASCLRSEEAAEREADRAYWAPLRARLEEMRMNRPRS